MNGSILLQIIVIVGIIYMVITLPEIYNDIRLVMIFIPFLIIMNIFRELSEQ